jgi:hypothetical protein
MLSKEVELLLYKAHCTNQLKDYLMLIGAFILLKEKL